MSGYVSFRERFGCIESRECEPSYTLEQHIASLRDGDPERWAKLQAEWNEPCRELSGKREN